MSTVADPTGQKFHKAWGTRLQSLRNIPPVLRIIWDSSPAVVTWGLILRAISALSPLALLAVARLIIDAVVVHISHDTPLRTDFWWLVGLEFGLACLASVLNRIVDYCDTLLADKFIRHISVRIMHHASRLDLASYEDPLFHDKLERARVQATDRLGMVQQLGRLVQQVITTATLAASILLFSPWLLLVLIACVIPAFLGESHFAFLGYALAFRLTPVKRQIDYLRFLGASKDGAKELKLFGLSKFLTDRFQQLSDDVYLQNVALAKRRLVASALLSLLTTDRILRRLRVRHPGNGQRKNERGHADLSDRRDCGRQRQPADDFFDFFKHCRPVAVPYRPAAIFCSAPDGFFQAQCVEDASAHPARN